jgi:hypothetical protein
MFLNFLQKNFFTSVLALFENFEAKRAKNGLKIKKRIL